MRIVVDMQGAQSESRFRGIGRYTMAFSKAVVRNSGDHEVLLALNGLFPETIEPIRASFDGLLPQENIRVWHAPGPVRSVEPDNDMRREVAELLREAFIQSLRADVVHICGPFEGFVDDAVTSVARFDCTTPVSVTVHDLIPILNEDYYLTPHPRFAEDYYRKVEYLKKATFYLGVSNSSCQEVKALGVPIERVVNTSEGVGEEFRPLEISNSEKIRLKEKYGVMRDFVLYTGGGDERKNLVRLVQAYGMLPRSVRNNYQLVLSGKIPSGELATIKNERDRIGLGNADLILAGYVSDDELVELYNLCNLYVFPSWHEGFGLPALEAMASGAPVIGSNTSSLPEVIGWEAALFDPYDVDSMATKIEEALTDARFRSALREHGLQQAKKFSWDAAAQRAVEAWENIPHEQWPQGHTRESQGRGALLESLAEHLAGTDSFVLRSVSKCVAMNEGAGIERQLLLDVSELCQKDAATGVQRVVRGYLEQLLDAAPAGFCVEPVYATQTTSYHYARKFKRRFLGASDEQVVDEPIDWQRGDVFFALDMQHHVQLAHRDFFQSLRRQGVIVKFLVHDLLPIQFPDLFVDESAKETHEQWLALIASTDGAICVSNATATAYQEWLTETATDTADRFTVSWVHNGADIDGTCPSHGMPANADVVLEKLRDRPSFLCVATLEPRKRQDEILDAVERLWRTGVDVNLVLVGHAGWNTEELSRRLKNHCENGNRLFWMEGVSDEFLGKVYEVCDCLIAASVNEGFGLPVVEAAQYQTAVIARDIPVFHEVANGHAYYFGGETGRNLEESIKQWLSLYQQGEHPWPSGIQWATWEKAARNLKQRLLDENCPRRQLLVDVSEIVHKDAKSGIQRVVRGVLWEWLTEPPDDYRVEPVYATLDDGYRYARDFTSKFRSGLPRNGDDEPIEFNPGDVFFGLDMQPEVVAKHREFYQRLRRHGVTVQFLVHDLLFIQMPQYVDPVTVRVLHPWLEVVTESDGAVCVSKTVAEQLSEWVERNAKGRSRRFNITWSHNGADIAASLPTAGLPDDWAEVQDRLSSRRTFLMVGTLEPRKGHALVVEAVQRLWTLGVDVNLVIVGKKGWMVENLAEVLRSHQETGRRLFWFDGISDEYLERLYGEADALIAASEGEGFGLPLIEAAQQKLPIIARDIEVFREVAGDHAYYFVDSNSPQTLAKALQEWLVLYEKSEHPKPEGMNWRTWQESAQELLNVILPVARAKEKDGESRGVGRGRGSMVPDNA